MPDSVPAIGLDEFLKSGVDLNACDLEPIHIPGSIQPHGLLLVVDPDSETVVAGAGRIESRLAGKWLGRSLADVLGRPVDLEASRSVLSPLGRIEGTAESFEASAHASGRLLVVELEPASTAPLTPAGALAMLEAVNASFERATDLHALCARAAVEFRRLTGFDRVMVYRFLDDDAGVVVAEDNDPSMSSFLNHHFPATDIPKQARALYVRNRLRVIPDVSYEPAPLRGSRLGGAPLDMSDAALRSVSPIHIQYLKNMEIGASASVSIVKDGLLWGLIACHNQTPKLIPLEVRAICRALAGGLSQQIRAKEEAESYRERIRLRGFEDDVLAQLGGDEPFETVFARIAPELREMLSADGVALLQEGRVSANGACPSKSQIIELGGWVEERASVEPFSSDQLSAQHPESAAFTARASGLLAITVSSSEPSVLMWFRAEKLEVVNWAGNPHKDLEGGEAGLLTPRGSFEAWREAVRGRAAPWTLAEIEAASRLRRMIFEARQNRRLRELNQELGRTVADKETLLQQKDYLLKEVNHRVQNSLQLVSSFLGLQARAVEDPALAPHLEEAQRRLVAVALVHRRLYRADQVEAIELSRYLEELCLEMKESMDPGWAPLIRESFAPMSISADRAVSVGLILTELVINANKYAYDGKPGPIDIVLEQHRSQFRLIVADNGSGATQPGKGFGTRMIGMIVTRLSGTIETVSNNPGLRTVVTAPLQAPRSA